MTTKKIPQPQEYDSKTNEEMCADFNGACSWIPDHEEKSITCYWCSKSIYLPKYFMGRKRENIKKGIIKRSRPFVRKGKTLEPTYTREQCKTLIKFIDSHRFESKNKPIKCDVCDWSKPSITFTMTCLHCGHETDMLKWHPNIYPTVRNAQIKKKGLEYLEDWCKAFDRARDQIKKIKKTRREIKSENRVDKVVNKC